MTLRGVRPERWIEHAGGIFVAGQSRHFSLGDGKMAHAVFPRALVCSPGWGKQGRTARWPSLPLRPGRTDPFGRGGGWCPVPIPIQGSGAVEASGRSACGRRTQDSERRQPTVHRSRSCRPQCKPSTFCDEAIEPGTPPNGSRGLPARFRLRFCHQIFTNY